MPVRKGKRDNAYYELRLAAEHAAIYAAYKAGKHGSLHAACVEAGLKKERTPLQELKSGWAKASKAERDEFQVWCKGHPWPTSGSLPPAVFDADDRLTPWAVRRIRDIMKMKAMKSAGDVTRAIGINPLNPSIGNAIHQRWRIKDVNVQKALEEWVNAV